jgi:hypothetical protein
MPGWFLGDAPGVNGGAQPALQAQRNGLTSKGELQLAVSGAAVYNPADRIRRVLAVRHGWQE